MYKIKWHKIFPFFFSYSQLWELDELEKLQQERSEIVNNLAKFKDADIPKYSYTSLITQLDILNLKIDNLLK